MALNIISRRAALAQGLKRYFSGVACKRGHLTERQVSSLTCMECDREKQKASYDPEKNRVNGKRWRAANVEKIKQEKRDYNKLPQRKAYAAAWYAENRDRIVEKRRKEYPDKRRAKNIASAKAWAEANPEKASEYYRLNTRKRRALKKNSGGNHTAADLAEILKAQNHRCAYCKCDLRKVKKHVDHILPLALGGSNGRANLQYLCRPCNQSKSARDPVTYARSIGLLL